ncbi:glycerophosphodiester phosphodiesterase family protein [Lysinibacillus sp. KU-BSD001]|uniref:glycerophosphodiester phosphodiesterase n=1 Tax=Lysinibacillus sp. KU-BSD001 TaxID=3141328 RepID=UPI0036E52593
MKRWYVLLAVIIATTLFTLNFGDSSTHKPFIIAHRGASYYAPEHSFEAYDLALTQGADYLEFDTQMTKDHVLVIEHDKVPSYGDGRTIPDYTATELKQLKRANELGSSSILTLQEVLTHYPTTPLYIETKNRRDGVEEMLLKELQAAGRLHDKSLIIQSFSAKSLRLLREQNHSIQLFQLFTKEGTHELTREKLQQVRQYANGIIIHQQAVTEALIHLAHAEQLKVHVYTVNNPRHMKKLIEQQIDGIITDRPDVLYELLY